MLVGGLFSTHPLLKMQPTNVELESSLLKNETSSLKKSSPVSEEVLSQLLFSNEVVSKSHSSPTAVLQKIPIEVLDNNKTSRSETSAFSGLRFASLSVEPSESTIGK